ncbi:hypothetical protein D3C80_2152900 [compost metagenome]
MEVLGEGRCRDHGYPHAFADERKRGGPVTYGQADIGQRETFTFHEAPAMQMAAPGGDDEGLVDQFG